MRTKLLNPFSANILAQPFKAGRVLLIGIFMLICFAAHPLENLCIELAPNGIAPEAYTELQLIAAPVGSRLHTKIIHSVELTPVIDIYSLQQGQLWIWQEYFRSQNAGLPLAPPPGGYFRQQKNWLVIEGAGRPVKELFYRVGSEELGKNELRIPPAEWLPVWTKLNGSRLRMSLFGCSAYAALKRCGSLERLTQ